jgi:hypothetical protein
MVPVWGYSLLWPSATSEIPVVLASTDMGKTSRVAGLICHNRERSYRMRAIAGLASESQAVYRQRAARRRPIYRVPTGAVTHPTWCAS